MIKVCHFDNWIDQCNSLAKYYVYMKYLGEDVERKCVITSSVMKY